MKNPGKITDNLPESQDFVAPLVRSKKNSSVKRSNIAASSKDVAEDAVPKNTTHDHRAGKCFISQCQRQH